MAKLCLVFLPILISILIGISRVDDYWHHWTDVFAGAIIGIFVASFSYLHFFPYPYDENGIKPKQTKNYHHVIAFLIIITVDDNILTGWAPHAYFRMLAERSTGRATTMTRTGSRGMLGNDVEPGNSASSPHDRHRESTDSDF